MEFPNILREEIEKRTDRLSVSAMKNMVQSMTERYKNHSGNGKSLVNTDEEAAVYAAVRMPATFGAVSAALSYTLELWDGQINSVIDAGAGTGAASWAFAGLTEASEYTCIECEPVMRKLGKELMADSEYQLSSAVWKPGNIVKEPVEDKADAVVASYVLNELEEKDIDAAAVKLWNAASKLLLIVEPGTPAGFSVIRRIRQKLLELGANIVSPCVCDECGMADDDWCHFTCRVARSRLHKLLKGGDVPYEDEKFSYIAFSRTKSTDVHDRLRIIRHPEVQKGYIKLRACTDKGICDMKVTRKDGERFKCARKSACGDIL